MQVTRESILRILQERGQATVEELSAEIHLTPATVRHHLDMLRGENLVEAPSIRRRTTPGRPQYVYTLTEAADQFFPKSYASLATMMFGEIQERLEPAHVEEMLRTMAGRIAAEFPPAPPGEDFDARLSRVVDFLNKRGHLARSVKGEDGYMLYLTNCLYREVSHTHPQLCVMDMSLVAQLLQVTPHRVSSMANDQEACIFHFKAPAENGAPADAPPV